MTESSEASNPLEVAAGVLFVLSNILLLVQSSAASARSGGGGVDLRFSVATGIDVGGGSSNNGDNEVPSSLVSVVVTVSTFPSNN